LSIIVPDMIILEGSPNAWIQPLHFLPNSLWENSEDILAALWVDISCGQTVMVGFKSSDFVRRYEDGSELYRCEVVGPENLFDYATGPLVWENDRPLVLLFHHTSEKARSAIIESGHFNSSSWNMQGTKKLLNTAFVYFTPIPKLDCENCLGAVAMASKGIIRFRRDRPPFPPIFISHDLSIFSSDVLELKVKRGSTRNRTATVDLWIDPGLVCPQHLLRHFDGQSQTWYEVISAFTIRIALEIDGTLPLSNQTLHCDYKLARHPSHVVLGDAWRLDGLAAPFDEENTEFRLEIQRVNSGNILSYWFDMGSSNGFPIIEAKG